MPANGGRDASSEQLQRLGREVRQRRIKLGLTQEEVAERGGPSTTTQTGIERADTPTPSPSTLKKLDKGLGWITGSARALLYQGAEPREVPSSDLGDTSPLRSLLPLPEIERGPLGRLLDIRRQIDIVIDQLRAELPGQ